MSWIVNTPISHFQRFCINVIKSGHVPNHVAIIMDGNRRYASKTNVKRAVGHTKGFDKLAETFQWCIELGIKEVTVYAFSIENFKRSEDEVDTLMQLAREKYQRLIEEKDKLMAEGVCIRVIGNLLLLPKDLRKSIAEAVIMTKDNNRIFLNIGMAYTSRDEITNSIRTVMDCVKSNMISVEDINEDLLAKCLYTNHSSDPDLIVRTSGEIRFSDFLLWQILGASICFTSVLWPEFSIWHLLAAIFFYQRSHKYLPPRKQLRTRSTNECTNEFCLTIDHMRFKQLEQLANENVECC